MTTTTKKITKKDNYNTVLALIGVAEQQGVELPEGITYEGLNQFVNHEIELLDTKAAAAAKRAADKKVEGDALRDKIYGFLTTETQTIAEIVAKVGDPDVSPQMVTARLTQLVNLDQVVREQVTVAATTEGGKSRKVSAYRLA